jgi:hypothetical protein
MSLSAAKSRVMQARTQLETGRIDDVDPTLLAAERFLDGLPDDERAPLLAQITAIRAELANVIKPEDERKISAANGKLRQARSQIEAGPPPAGAAPAGSAPVTRAHTSDEDASNISRARSRIVQARSLLESRRTENVEFTLEYAAAILAGVGEAPAAPLLAEIDELRAQLAGAIGLDQREAYVATSDLQTLKPDADPDA